MADTYTAIHFTGWSWLRNIIINTPSNYTRVPNTRESAVEVVTGQVARALLGGLSQIFQWYETEELAE